MGYCHTAVGSFKNTVAVSAARLERNSFCFLFWLFALFQIEVGFFAHSKTAFHLFMWVLHRSHLKLVGEGKWSLLHNRKIVEYKEGFELLFKRKNKKSGRKKIPNSDMNLQETKSSAKSRTEPCSKTHWRSRLNITVESRLKSRAGS